MKQWFLRITNYADRLLAGLDDLDWPERAKRLQRQWIGRSDGREIDFDDLTVFTTRPDTLPAVTFIAVPTGHPAAGRSVTHPLTGEPLPVHEADFVIDAYGTGAVMGVPAHDERDARFAAQHGIAVSNAELLSAERGCVRRPTGGATSPPRLADLATALLGATDPHRPLPPLRARRRTRRPTPGLAPPHRQLPPHGDRAFTTRPSTRLGQRHMPGVQRTRSNARQTSATPSSTPRGISCATPPPTSTTGRGIPTGPHGSFRSTSTPAGPSTFNGTTSTPDSSRWPCTISDWSRSLSHFHGIRLGGMIVRHGAKMSKSRGNVVTPDDYINVHGADVLRCALLFAAPWEQGGDFADDGIVGIERFFTRTWRIVTGPDGPAADPAQLAHTIIDVTDAIERRTFNVGLARLMEFVPSAGSSERQESPRPAARTLCAPPGRRAVAPTR